MADYRSLIAKYFPANQVDNAYRVMLGESRGDPRAHASQGEDSRGLFQLNVAKGANPQLAQYNLYDPETNVRLAAQMYSERGWQPWTAAQKLGIVSGAPQQEGTMAETGITPPNEIDEALIALKEQIKAAQALATSADVDERFFGEKRLTQLNDDYNALLRIKYSSGNQPKAGPMSPVYDPRTAQEPYMTPWGEPTGGSKGDVIGLQNPATGSIYTLPTAASAPKGTEWQDPSDGSQWLIDGQGNKTKQLSPAIPGWTPGLGVRWPSQPAAPAPQYPNVFTQGRSAYKSDPYTGEVTKVYDFEEALPTAWDREKEANDKWYKQETLDAQREANRRSAENAAFGHISNLWTSSLPYAVRPGQKQPVGFEAGGPYARLLGMAGSPYNPADYEMPVQQLDPLGMYRQAQTMINQQGGK